MLDKQDLPAHSGLMNRLSAEKRIAVVAALVEGCGLRATARMTGVARMTVEKLLRDLGAACAQYQDEYLRNLNCRRIECDEIWSFVYAKQKNVDSAKNAPEVAGDVWTWTAIDPDTKLVPSWCIGSRDTATAYDFMHDLADRLRHRVQLTTDGHRPYLEAVESAFNLDIDYAMLIKIYGADPEAEKRYTPARCQGCDVKVVTDEPNPNEMNHETLYQMLVSTPEPSYFDLPLLERRGVRRIFGWARVPHPATFGRWLRGSAAVPSPLLDELLWRMVRRRWISCTTIS